MISKPLNTHHGLKLHPPRSSVMYTTNGMLINILLIVIDYVLIADYIFYIIVN